MSGVIIDVNARADKAQQDLSQINNTLSQIQGTSTRLTQSLAGLARSLGAVVAGGLSIGYLVRVNAEFQNLSNRVALVTKNSQELLSVQKELLDTTFRTRSNLSAVATTYNTIAASMKRFGKPMSQVLQVTEAIQKSLAISGSSAEAGAAAIIQLGQGLGAGALRGQEYMSVMEQARRIGMAIADDLKINIGQLKEMADAGKLTTDVVFGAMLRQSEKIGEEFAKIVPPLQSVIPLVGLATREFVNNLDKALGLTRFMSIGLNKVVSILRVAGTQVGDLVEDLKFSSRAEGIRSFINGFKLLAPEIKRTGVAIVALVKLISKQVVAAFPTVELTATLRRHFGVFIRSVDAMMGGAGTQFREIFQRKFLRWFSLRDEVTLAVTDLALLNPKYWLTSGFNIETIKSLFSVEHVATFANALERLVAGMSDSGELVGATWDWLKPWVRQISYFVRDVARYFGFLPDTFITLRVGAVEPLVRSIDSLTRGFGASYISAYRWETLFVDFRSKVSGLAVTALDIFKQIPKMLFNAGVAIINSLSSLLTRVVQVFADFLRKGSLFKPYLDLEVRLPSYTEFRYKLVNWFRKLTSKDLPWYSADSFDILPEFTEGMLPKIPDSWKAKFSYFLEDAHNSLTGGKNNSLFDELFKDDISVGPLAKKLGSVWESFAPSTDTISGALGAFIKPIGAAIAGFSASIDNLFSSIANSSGLKVAIDKIKGLLSTTLSISITDLFKGNNDKSEIFSNISDALARGLKKAHEYFKEFIGSVQRDLKSSADWREFSNSLVAAFRRIRTTVTSFKIGDIFESIKSGFYSAKSAVSSFMEVIESFTDKDTRILRLAKLAIRLTDIKATLRGLKIGSSPFSAPQLSFLSDLGKKLGGDANIFGKAFIQIEDYINGVLSSLFSRLTLLQRLMVKNLLQQMYFAIADTTAQIQRLFTKIFSFDFIKSVFESIRTFLPTALKAIRDFASSVIDAFFRIYDEVIGNSWWTDTITAIHNSSAGLWRATRAGFAEFSRGVETTFRDIFKTSQGFKSFFSDFYEDVIQDNTVRLVSIAARLGLMLMAAIFAPDSIKKTIVSALAIANLQDLAVIGDVVSQHFFDKSLVMATTQEIALWVGKIISLVLGELPALIGTLLSGISGAFRGLIGELPFIGIISKMLFAITDLIGLSGPLGLVGGILFGYNALKLLSTFGFFTDTFKKFETAAKTFSKLTADSSRKWHPRSQRFVTTKAGPLRGIGKAGVIGGMAAFAITSGAASSLFAGAGIAQALVGLAGLLAFLGGRGSRSLRLFGRTAIATFSGMSAGAKNTISVLTNLVVVSRRVFTLISFLWNVTHQNNQKGLVKFVTDSLAMIRRFSSVSRLLIAGILLTSVSGVFASTLTDSVAEGFTDGISSAAGVIESAFKPVLFALGTAWVARVAWGLRDVFKELWLITRKGADISRRVNADPGGSKVKETAKNVVIAAGAATAFAGAGLITLITALIRSLISPFTRFSGMLGKAAEKASAGLDSLLNAFRQMEGLEKIFGKIRDSLDRRFRKPGRTGGVTNDVVIGAAVGSFAGNTAARAANWEIVPDLPAPGGRKFKFGNKRKSDAEDVSYNQGLLLGYDPKSLPPVDFGRAGRVAGALAVGSATAFGALGGLKENGLFGAVESAMTFGVISSMLVGVVAKAIRGLTGTKIGDMFAAIATKLVRNIVVTTVIGVLKSTAVVIAAKVVGVVLLIATSILAVAAAFFGEGETYFQRLNDLTSSLLRKLGFETVGTAQGRYGNLTSEENKKAVELRDFNLLEVNANKISKKDDERIKAAFAKRNELADQYRGLEEEERDGAQGKQLLADIKRQEERLSRLFDKYRWSIPDTNEKAAKMLEERLRPENLNFFQRVGATFQAEFRDKYALAKGGINWVGNKLGIIGDEEYARRSEYLASPQFRDPLFIDKLPEAQILADAFRRNAEWTAVDDPQMRAEVANKFTSIQVLQDKLKNAVSIYGSFAGNDQLGQLLVTLSDGTNETVTFEKALARLKTSMLELANDLSIGSALVARQKEVERFRAQLEMLPTALESYGSSSKREDLLFLLPSDLDTVEAYSKELKVLAENRDRFTVNGEEYRQMDDIIKSIVKRMDEWIQKRGKLAQMAPTDRLMATIGADSNSPISASEAAKLGKVQAANLMRVYEQAESLINQAEMFRGHWNFLTIPEGFDEELAERLRMTNSQTAFLKIINDWKKSYVDSISDVELAISDSLARLSAASGISLGPSALAGRLGPAELERKKAQAEALRNIRKQREDVEKQYGPSIAPEIKLSLDEKVMDLIQQESNLLYQNEQEDAYLTRYLGFMDSNSVERLDRAISLLGISAERFYDMPYKLQQESLELADIIRALEFNKATPNLPDFVAEAINRELANAYKKQMELQSIAFQSRPGATRIEEIGNVPGGFSTDSLSKLSEATVAGLIDLGGVISTIDEEIRVASAKGASVPELLKLYKKRSLAVLESFEDTLDALVSTMSFSSILSDIEAKLDTNISAKELARVGGRALPLLKEAMSLDYWFEKMPAELQLELAEWYQGSKRILRNQAEQLVNSVRTPVGKAEASLKAIDVSAGSGLKFASDAFLKDVTDRAIEIKNAMDKAEEIVDEKLRQEEQKRIAKLLYDLNKDVARGSRGYKEDPASIAGANFAESIISGFKEGAKGLLSGELTPAEFFKNFFKTIAETTINTMIEGFAQGLVGENGIIRNMLTDLGIKIFTQNMSAGQMLATGATSFGGHVQAFGAWVTALATQSGGNIAGALSLFGAGSASGTYGGSNPLGMLRTIANFANPFSASAQTTIGAISNSPMVLDWKTGLLIPGMSTGGYVVGPGTGTSDSILARVSNGEFVINAASASANRPLLEAINSGQFKGQIVRGGDVSRYPGSTGARGNTVVNLNVTGDISRQTKAEIYRMLPNIAEGVNSHNRERNYGA